MRKSGLTAVLTAWPTVYCGLSASPGLSASKLAPRGANGVMVCPVLRICGSPLFRPWARTTGTLRKQKLAMLVIAR